MMAHRHTYMYIYIPNQHAVPSIILHVLNTYGNYGFLAIHMESISKGGFEAYLVQSQEVTYATHYSSEPIPTVQQIIDAYLQEQATLASTVTVIDNLTGEGTAVILTEEEQERRKQIAEQVREIEARH